MSNINIDQIITPSVFRYKFDPTLSNLMEEFARIHRLDSRNDFKENFELWFTSNQEVIDREQTRLDSIGCSDDIKIKLFRSIKYYYAKKKGDRICGNVDEYGNIQTSRPERYVQHSKEFKDTVIKFITDECIMKGLSPKKGYELLISQPRLWIHHEIQRLNENFGLLFEDAHGKIKKTFKNYYFQKNKTTSSTIQK